MLDKPCDSRKQIIGAIVRLTVLLSLYLWLFGSEWSRIIKPSVILRSSETAHILLIPVMAVMLIWHRRSALEKNLSKGSILGFIFLIFGLLLYAVTIWPFDYAYARYLVMVPVMGCALWIACGWRVLKLSIPVLLLILISIPMGPRLYASIAVRLETRTIAATSIVLDKLPDVDTQLDGVDLSFSSKGYSSIIGLGQSYRGMRLLFAYAVIGIFIVFSEMRSFLRYLFVSTAAIPIILFCNLFRFLFWGLMAIYTQSGPEKIILQNISDVCSLFVSYALFYLVCQGRLNLFVDVEENTISKGEVADAKIKAS